MALLTTTMKCFSHSSLGVESGINKSTQMFTVCAGYKTGKIDGGGEQTAGMFFVIAEIAAVFDHVYKCAGGERLVRVSNMTVLVENTQVMMKFDYV